MAIIARPQTASPDYIRAPWQLRVSWWLAERLWSWGRGFEEMGAQSADQINPLWRR